MLNVLDWEIKFQQTDPFNELNVMDVTNEYTDKIEVNFRRIRKEHLKV